VTAFEAPPVSQPVAADPRLICQGCGTEIRGRRRNGFCGDACRMRFRREQIAVKRRPLVDRLKRVVHDVERELLR